MKKIYYLLAFFTAAVAFTACNPLDKTYQAIGPVPVPTAPAQTITYTLVAADYALVPKGSAAIKTLSFASKDSAAIQIPSILASKYSNYPDKSTATITYAYSPVSITVADSLYSNVAHTVTTAEYTAVTGRFLDFSDAQALSFLAKYYPTPVANQLVVLNYTYFLSGVTTSAGTPNTIDSFIYLNGVWTKIYTVSPAQYAAIGHSTYNQFVAADLPNIASILKTFLKNDATVMATAKFGDVKYVSYNYFASSKTYQIVRAFTFDGTNWVNTSTPLTLAFAKTNGKWVADNTITYSLVTADYKYIATSVATGATQSAVDNLNSFGNFNIQGGATTWTDAQINTGLIGFLKNKYGTIAVANQKFVITYSAYSGSNVNVTKTFQYDGTAFALVQ